MSPEEIMTHLRADKENVIYWLVAGPPDIPRFGISIKVKGSHMKKSIALEFKRDFRTVECMWLKGDLVIDTNAEVKSLFRFLRGDIGAFTLSPKASFLEKSNAV